MLFSCVVVASVKKLEKERERRRREVVCGGCVGVCAAWRLD